jgi:hypothetical protein
LLGLVPGHQPPGQLLGRLVGQTREGAFLAGDAALLGPQMALVQLDQPLPGEPAQPGVKGQRPLLQVAGQLADRVRQGFLHHVGGVHARRQAPVEADGDHLPQAAAVARQQLLTGAALAAAGAFQELLGVRVETSHGWRSLQHQSSRAGKKVTPRCRKTPVSPGRVLKR